MKELREMIDILFEAISTCLQHILRYSLLTLSAYARTDTIQNCFQIFQLSIQNYGKFVMYVIKFYTAKYL